MHGMKLGEGFTYVEISVSPDLSKLASWREHCCCFNFIFSLANSLSCYSYLICRILSFASLTSFLKASILLLSSSLIWDFAGFTILFGRDETGISYWFWSDFYYNVEAPDTSNWLLLIRDIPWFSGSLADYMLDLEKSLILKPISRLKIFTLSFKSLFKSDFSPRVLATD